MRPSPPYLAPSRPPDLIRRHPAVRRHRIGRGRPRSGRPAAHPAPRARPLGEPCAQRPSPWTHSPSRRRLLHHRLCPLPAPRRARCRGDRRRVSPISQLTRSRATARRARSGGGVARTAGRAPPAGTTPPTAARAGARARRPPGPRRPLDPMCGLRYSGGWAEPAPTPPPPRPSRAAGDRPGSPAAVDSRWVGLTAKKRRKLGAEFHAARIGARFGPDSARNGPNRPATSPLGTWSGNFRHFRR